VKIVSYIYFETYYYILKKDYKQKTGAKKMDTTHLNNAKKIYGFSLDFALKGNKLLVANKESLVMSDDNKPIFIDPKKYPSPHMIIYDLQ